MPQAVFDRVGLDATGQLVHEAFMREGILQSLRRTQRTGEKWRGGIVNQRPFRFDRAGALGRFADGPREIGGDAVAAVVVVPRLGRGRSGLERLRLKAREHAADNIPRGAIARAIPEDWR